MIEEKSFSTATDDVFNGVGVEVILNNPEDFLKVRETLSRIGIASRKTKTLYQSASILHKRGHYAIVHFKELFYLDGKSVDFTEEDKARRNTIANLLEQWGLVKLKDPEYSKQPVVPLSAVKILKHSEKNDWKLEQKYTMSSDRKGV